jgi:hypothetical protein
VPTALLLDWCKAVGALDFYREDECGKIPLTVASTRLGRSRVLAWLVDWTCALGWLAALTLLGLVVTTTAGTRVVAALGSSRPTG